MDKAQALHRFWSMFGIPAYDENTVPEGSNLPYITYQGILADISYTGAVNASIWYHSLSWEAITKKAKQIGDAIGWGGMTIPYNNGLLWIKRGMPYAQRMSDPDPMIRRILLTIEIDFLSED